MARVCGVPPCASAEVGMLAEPVGSLGFAVPYRGGLCPAMPVLWDGCVWGPFSAWDGSW